MGKKGRPPRPLSRPRLLLLGSQGRVEEKARSSKGARREPEGSQKGRRNLAWPASGRQWREAEVGRAQLPPRDNPGESEREPFEMAVRSHLFLVLRLLLRHSSLPRLFAEFTRRAPRSRRHNNQNDPLTPGAGKKRTCFFGFIAIARSPTYDSHYCRLRTIGGSGRGQPVMVLATGVAVGGRGGRGRAVK
jgi:hypothetical protein